MKTHLSLTAAASLFFAGLACAADAPAGPPPKPAKSIAPPCWPKQIGSTGTDFKAGETETTRWIAWVCVVKKQPMTYGLVGIKGLKASYPDLAGLTSIKSAAAYFNANAGDPNDPRLAAGWEAIHQAYAVKP